MDLLALKHTDMEIMFHVAYYILSISFLKKYIIYLKFLNTVEQNMW